MSGAVSLTTVAAAVSTVASIYTMTQRSKQQQQQQAAIAPPPAPEPPPPLPQGSKAPDVNVVRRANAGAEGGGVNSPNNTLLTGPSGVSNDLLSLGKNTLLGA